MAWHLISPVTIKSLIFQHHLLWSRFNTRCRDSSDRRNTKDNWDSKPSTVKRLLPTLLLYGRHTVMKTQNFGGRSLGINHATYFLHIWTRVHYFCSGGLLGLKGSCSHVQVVITGFSFWLEKMHTSTDTASTRCFRAMSVISTIKPSFAQLSRLLHIYIVECLGMKPSFLCFQTKIMFGECQYGTMYIGLCMPGPCKLFSFYKNRTVSS